jgi:predicted MPP superfamily phosphohydrolase
LVAGAVICAVALAVVAAVLPSADLLRGASGVGREPSRGGRAGQHRRAGRRYLAVAALVWAIADATMAQPQDLDEFAQRPSAGRTWRVAHLSDVHTVGEFYGRRIESGRSGASGNERLRGCSPNWIGSTPSEPLDVVLISGDMTDAGRSSEWADFLDALSRYPALPRATLMIPGNHDLNIVDRANPAGSICRPARTSGLRKAARPVRRWASASRRARVHVVIARAAVGRDSRAGA